MKKKISKDMANRGFSSLPEVKFRVVKKSDGNIYLSKGFDMIVLDKEETKVLFDFILKNNRRFDNNEKNKLEEKIHSTG